MTAMGRLLSVPLATGLILAGAAPAQAHAGLVLTVDADGRGSIAVRAVWADGHPVTEPMAATMTAVPERGRAVGPVALTRLPGEPTVVYPATLRPGSWQVTVDLALPGVGHCTAPVTVAAAAQMAKPSSTRCGEPSPAAAAASAVTPAQSGPPWPLFAAAGVIVLGTAAAIVMRSRAARRP